MAGSPNLKVFSKTGEYVAACKHGEDAAAVVALYGHGATIRYGHSVKSTVWREGRERQVAGESFDHVAEVIARRVAYLESFGGEVLAHALAEKNPPREVQS